MDEDTSTAKEPEVVPMDDPNVPYSLVPVSPVGESPSLPPPVEPPPAVIPEKGKHIFVMYRGTTDYVLEDAPADWNNDWRLSHRGRNIEHSGEDAYGVWCYREQ